jgi:oligopeptide/dipeptide ABC transporter ATP-binding protein
LENSIIKVQDLKTYFYLDEGIVKAVDGVSFDIEAKKTLGVMGESGCGKSVTALSILRILPRQAKIVGGKIFLNKDNQNSLEITSFKPDSKEMRNIRGKEISMIFQEPMTSFSPVHTIGNQILESIYYHDTKDKKLAMEKALDMLCKVGVSNPRQRMSEYPHQLSGGLRQRSMIAMALVCRPKLLIADEPTTALDVTIQAQILELMQCLQEDLGMAIMFITHSLGVISSISQKVAVMYLGRIVEFATTRNIFKNPKHPYTVSLMESVPSIGRRARTRLKAIKGNVPIPLDPVPQCGFYERCPKAMDGVCNEAIPGLAEIEEGHFVRCFLHSDLKETDNDQ